MTDMPNMYYLPAHFLWLNFHMNVQENGYLEAITIYGSATNIGHSFLIYCWLQRACFSTVNTCWYLVTETHALFSRRNGERLEYMCNKWWADNAQWANDISNRRSSEKKSAHRDCVLKTQYMHVCGTSTGYLIPNTVHIKFPTHSERNEFLPLVYNDITSSICLLVGEHARSAAGSHPHLMHHPRNKLPGVATTQLCQTNACTKLCTPSGHGLCTFRMRICLDGFIHWFPFCTNWNSQNFKWQAFCQVCYYYRR